MLPYYGVFDELSFQVDGSRVVLTGEVGASVPEVGCRECRAPHPRE